MRGKKSEEMYMFKNVLFYIEPFHAKLFFSDKNSQNLSNTKYW